MFYPPLAVRRVDRLKYLNTERERAMERYLDDRAALEMEYSDPYKPQYKEIGNVVAGRLDNKIKKIHKEGGGEKEEEGLKGDDDGAGDDVGEV